MSDNNLMPKRPDLPADQEWIDRYLADRGLVRKEVADWMKQVAGVMGRRARAVIEKTAVDLLLERTP